MVKEEQVKGYNLIKASYNDLIRTLEKDSTKDFVEKTIIKINSLQSLKKIAKECELNSDVQIWQDMEDKLRKDLKESGFSI
jgi:hypothetical protein